MFLFITSHAEPHPHRRGVRINHDEILHLRAYLSIHILVCTITCSIRNGTSSNSKLFITNLRFITRGSRVGELDLRITDGNFKYGNKYEIAVGQYKFALLLFNQHML